MCRQTAAGWEWRRGRIRTLAERQAAAYNGRGGPEARPSEATSAFTPTCQSAVSAVAHAGARRVPPSAPEPREKRPGFTNSGGVGRPESGVLNRRDPYFRIAKSLRRLEVEVAAHSAGERGPHFANGTVLPTGSVSPSSKRPSAIDSIPDFGNHCALTAGEAGHIATGVASPAQYLLAPLRGAGTTTDDAATLHTDHSPRPADGARRPDRPHCARTGHPHHLRRVAPAGAGRGVCAGGGRCEARRPDRHGAAERHPERRHVPGGRDGRHRGAVEPRLQGRRVQVLPRRHQCQGAAAATRRHRRGPARGRERPCRS